MNSFENKSQFQKEIRAEIHSKEGKRITNRRILKWDKTWLHDEIINKLNFDGKINKKSDGRCPRTGSYPNPADPKRMTKYRHNTPIKMDYNVKVIDRPNKQFGEELDNSKGDYHGRKNTPVIKVQAELIKCEECGCKTTIKDMKRGEKVCPQCGLIHEKIYINKRGE